MCPCGVVKWSVFVVVVVVVVVVFAFRSTCTTLCGDVVDLSLLSFLVKTWQGRFRWLKKCDRGGAGAGRRFRRKGWRVYPLENVGVHIIS